MSRYYLLAIPILIGISTGIFLSFFNFEENDAILTKNELIENGSPILGNRFAEITVLEWGDYQCTFCYRFHESSLEILIEEYVKPGKVKLVFKDFPLNGPDSILAAEAAYCAEDQGKYWEYHDELYNNWGGERTGWITKDSLEKFAQNVGLEINEFNSCLNAHKHHQKVLDLEKFGKELGVDATPSFFIFNDERVIKIRGNQPIDVFKKAIAEL